jgi:hypothetical protein
MAVSCWRRWAWRWRRVAVASLPARSRRIVGLALGGSALLLAGMATALYTGLLPFPDELRTTLAGVLGAVAAVDLLLGFWFFRSSLSS